MLLLDSIAVSPEALPPVVDFADLFGNKNPVEIEIGCGKGAFLLRRARAHPEINFLGIEWANQFYRFAADRMARWNLANVRIMRTDARLFLMLRVPPASLAALHVYHPDPWPKTRHQKRRLIQRDFVDALIRALKPGGRWAIQTDHAEYFEQIRALTTDRPDLQRAPFEDAAFDTIGERTATNYEIKYEREGRAIHRLAFRRIS